MEKIKMNKKKLKYGTLATVVTVVVIAAIVLVNVIFAVLSGRVETKIDLTSNKAFDISQQSIDYMNSLTEPVEIVTMADEAMFSTSSYVYYKQAYEVLKKYAVCSDNVTLKFVDMTKDPTYVNKYSTIYKGTIDPYSIVVTCGNRIKVFSINELYNIEMDSSYNSSITSSKAEQVITSAIMFVTNPDPMKAVIFSSETAGGSADNVTTLLSSNGYETVPLDPLAEEIPEDTDLIVINAPANDYPEEVIKTLYDFMENGGKYGKNLIYIADFNQKTTANIDAFLAEWGLQVGQNIVAETESKNVSNQNRFDIKTSISDTLADTYAANIPKLSLSVISSYSRPVNILFETSGIITTTPLLTTADTAYIYTDEINEAIQNGKQVNPELAAQNTMAVSTKTAYDENNNPVASKLLVVGSSYTLGSELTAKTYYNNGDFFISTVNYMTGKTNGISIVAKDLAAKTFDMDQKTYNAMAVIFIYLVPAVVLIAGITVWIRRRHK